MSYERKQDEETGFSQGKHPNFQEIKEILGPLEKPVRPRK